MSEYYRAIHYGRPLFQKLREENKLNSQAIWTIGSRMVMRNFQYSNWIENEASRMSVLGTRIQMGQTSTEMASDLVAGGYAN